MAAIFAAVYVDVAYLIVASSGLAVGAALGYFFGIRLYELRRIRRVLKIKNPDFCDLEHDEGTAKREKWERPRENSGALERRDRVRITKPIPGHAE
jgi:hypothetical protein